MLISEVTTCWLVVFVVLGHNQISCFQCRYYAKRLLMVASYYPCKHEELSILTLGKKQTPNT